MNCRKDFVDLRSDERDRLANALNELYANSVVQLFASAHHHGWPYVHRGPAFLPWHRWYILLFEQALQSVDSQVSLPYWDWGRADLVSDEWREFFGGRNNSGGRFDHWGYTRASAPEGDLADANQIRREVDRPTYRTFRQMEATSHAQGHWHVGGTMSQMSAPFDPLFYLHHCMVDRMWAYWQLAHPTASQYDRDAVGTDTTTDGIDYPSQVAAHDKMFSGSLGEGVTPAAMLDYSLLGYCYDFTPARQRSWLEPTLQVMMSEPAARPT